MRTASGAFSIFVRLFTLDLILSLRLRIHDPLLDLGCAGDLGGRSGAIIGFGWAFVGFDLTLFSFILILFPFIFAAGQLPDCAFYLV